MNDNNALRTGKSEFRYIPSHPEIFHLFEELNVGLLYVTDKLTVKQFNRKAADILNLDYNRYGWNDEYDLAEDQWHFLYDDFNEIDKSGFPECLISRDKSEISRTILIKNAYRDVNCWLRIKVKKTPGLGNKENFLLILEDAAEPQKWDHQLYGLYQIEQTILDQNDGDDNLLKGILTQLNELFPGLTMIYVGQDDSLIPGNVITGIGNGKIPAEDYPPGAVENTNFDQLPKEHITIEKLSVGHLAGLYQEALYEKGIRSTMTIPVILNNKLRGAVLLHADQDEYFPSMPMNLVWSIAGLFQKALNQIELWKQIERKNKQLKQVNEKRIHEIAKLSGLNNAIIKSTQAAILIINTDGLVEGLNPSARKLFGLKSGETANRMSCADFFPDKEIQRMRDQLRAEDGEPLEKNCEVLIRFSANRSPNPVESKMITRSGKIIPVLLTISALPNGGTQVGEYVVLAVDMTQIKLAEQSKLESERIKQVLLENVPDHIFRISRDGTFLDIFTSDESSMFATKADFQGKKIPTLLPPELAAKSMQALEQAFRCKDVVRFEYQLPVKQKERYFENRLVALSDRDALAIIRDITDMKLTENRLRTTMTQLNSLILNLNMGILFEDSSRRVVLTNQYYCKLFGFSFSPEELIGMDRWELARLSGRIIVSSDTFVSRINEISSKGECILGEEYELTDGRVFERDYIPIWLNEKLIGHLWQYRDITQQKLNEKYGYIQRDLRINLAEITNKFDAFNLVIGYMKKIEQVHCTSIHIMNKENGEFEQVASTCKTTCFSEKNLLSQQNAHLSDLIQQENVTDIRAVDFDPESTFYKNYPKGVIKFIPIRQNQVVIGAMIIETKSLKDLNPAANKAIEVISGYIGDALLKIEMQNNLELSRNNFQVLFETIDDFIIVLNSEGIIIKTNPAVRNQLGYTQAKLEGKNIKNVCADDAKTTIIQLITHYHTKKMELSQFSLLAKTGRPIPVEAKVLKGTWDGNDVFYMMSRDISGRLKAEQELRESEDRWHFALESSGDGIWDWNIPTNEVFFSHQWKKMLGYEEEEINGTLNEWESRIHPEDIEHVYTDLEAHFNGKSSLYQSEYRMKCKDGTFKWILNRGKVISWLSPGKPERIVGTHEDISARKAVEHSLSEALQKEKELNELKSRFVSMTSHEFRTPLATILMSADLLGAYFDRMSKKEISQKIDRIKNNVTFLKNIIEKVMDLSHLETGKMKFSPTVIEINGFLSEIIHEQVENLGSSHQIVFEELDHAVNVKVDKQMIKQVISNMLANSFKYSPEESVVKVILSSKPDDICIKITDHGIGIPAEDTEKIFEPFKRGSNVENIPGSGLGLALSRQFVRRHGGDIILEPCESGASFSVILPKWVRLDNKRSK